MNVKLRTGEGLLVLAWFLLAFGPLWLGLSSAVAGAALAFSTQEVPSAQPDPVEVVA